ncbi:MAG TPA: nuclear transport factor 2 family protein [Solirubrobacteraceae bacterium]|jgi:ketosteroid isomerase-like protein
MSQQNVRVVEAGLEAFNRGDVEGFADLTTDDFAWLTALAGAVERTRYTGRSGISRYFSESRDTWEQLTVVCDELRDLGGSVLALGRAVGRGSGSGAEVEMPLAFIAEFRGGLMAKASVYVDHADALKAVGLEE